MSINRFSLRQTKMRIQSVSRFAYALLLCLFLLAFGECAPPGTTPPSPVDKQLQQTIDNEMKRIMEANRLVGAAVGIIKDGKIFYQKGYGLADRENNIPVTTDTVFRWASMSKTITALVAMQLDEKRYLKLTDDVRTHLTDQRLKLLSYHTTDPHSLLLGASFAQLQNKLTELSKNDIELPLDIETYTENGKTKYAFLWRPNQRKKDWSVLYNATKKEMTDHLKKYVEGQRFFEIVHRKRLHPIDLDIHVTGGNVKYGVIGFEEKQVRYVRNPSAWKKSLSLGRQDLGEQHKANTKNGYRIVDIELYTNPEGQLRYAAVWKQDLSQQQTELFLVSDDDQDYSSYQEVLDAIQKKKGWNFLDFEYIVHKGKEYWAIIAQHYPQGSAKRKKILGTALRSQLTKQEFLTARREFGQKGYVLQDIEVDQNKEGKTVYAGIWRLTHPRAALWHNQAVAPGNVQPVSQRVIHANDDSYKQRFTELSNQGYRIQAVEAYRSMDSMRYSSLWIKDSKKQKWAALRNMSRESLQKKMTEYEGKRYRMLDVESYLNVEGKRLYAAVWEEACSSATIGGTCIADDRRIFEVSNEEYKKQFQKLKDNYMPVDIEAYTVDGKMVYTAIWKKNTNSTGWQAYRNLTWSEWHQRHISFSKEGFTIVDFECYDLNGETRYAGIWHKIAKHPMWSFRAVSGEKEFQKQERISTTLPKSLVRKDGTSTTALITMRRLLSNTSGIQQYPDGYEENILKYYNHDLSFQPMRAITAFKHIPLEFEPGTSYKYSSNGFNLAGAVMQAVTMQREGLTFAGWVDKYIAKPLKLTTLQPDYSDFVAIKNMARHYDEGNGSTRSEIDFVSISHKIPGGGFVSNIKDLTKYTLALMNKELLPAERYDNDMWVVQANNYGLGFQLGDRNRSRPTAGGTDMWIRHTGGQRGGNTVLYFSPAQKIGVVFMTNRRNTNSALTMSWIARRLAFLAGADMADSAFPPELGSISINTAKTGTRVALTVTGTRFDNGSTILLTNEATSTTTAITTKYINPTELRADPNLNLSSITAGTYKLSVRNSMGVETLRDKTFTVTD